MDGIFNVTLPDGGELRLHRLRPIDWLKLYDRYRTDRKIRLAQSMRMLDRSSDEIVAELRKFDASRVTQWEVQQWCVELDGAAEFLTLSINRGWELVRDGQTVESQPAGERKAEDIPACLPHESWVDAAAGVAGLELVAPTA